MQRVSYSPRDSCGKTGEFGRGQENKQQPERPVSRCESAQTAEVDTTKPGQPNTTKLLELVVSGYCVAARRNDSEQFWTIGQ